MSRAGMTILIFSFASTLAAQSLGDAATRERERRENGVSGPVKTFTNPDLRTPVANAAESPLDTAVESLEEATRRAAYRRHLASADAYLRQAELRLRQAADDWQLVVGQPYGGQALDEVRRRLDNTSLAFERARHYRNSAAIAARRAGVSDTWLK